MKFQTRNPVWAGLTAMLLIPLSACTGAPTPTPIVESPPATAASAPAPEVIVYAADLTASALEELDFMDDPSSPGAKLISLPNNGDELDPPPENDPHATFTVPVESGIPYRCWIHMKVGEAKGRSTANIVFVQFSTSVNEANEEIFRFSTNSFLTAQGPTQPGWSWVPCNAEGGESLVYFESGGESEVRIQAGAEGVGFDQFVLSGADFLDAAPTEAIIEK
jgi:hypothetical protein